MGRLEILRRRIRGRTPSEWRTNVEDEVWSHPRGKGVSAKDGKDGIAREQFIAKTLGDEGYDRRQILETHSGERIALGPKSRRELLRALGLGGLFVGGAYMLGRLGAPAGASPGSGISGPVLTSGGDIDAKRIGGVRYATEFDTAKHAGTVADPFTGTAIQNAIADGPYCFLSGVRFNAASAITLSGGPFYLIGYGPSTVLVSPANDILKATGNLSGGVPSDISLVLSDMHLESTSGNCLNLQAYSIDRTVLERLYMKVVTDGFSCIQSSAGLTFIENLMEMCHLQGTLTNTVPTINLIGGDGTINKNKWHKCRFTYSGNYAVLVSNAGPGSYAYDVILEDINFEVCNGGCVKILGGFAPVLSHCHVYDLSGATTNDLFVFDQSVGGTTISKNGILNNVQRRSGTLGTNLVDVRFLNGSRSFTIISPGTPSGSNFTIDLNGRDHFMVGIPSSVTIQNGQGLVEKLAYGELDVNGQIVLFDNQGGNNERARLESGSAGNRGVIKLWDVGAAAFRYAYLNSGAWVISTTEPT